ncbi:MAG: DUF2628 domain-containing protein [Bacteroidota bacterium]|nr:DUF2628 domain-containing protein [Bacteroidota bacterium]
MTIPDIQIDQITRNPYYREEFQKIMESNGKYKGKWNWWAFILTAFWAIAKGCWVLGLFIIISSIVINILLPIGKYELGDHVFLTFSGIAGVWACIMGWRGTWFYYQTRIGKHLGKGV